MNIGSRNLQKHIDNNFHEEQSFGLKRTIRWRATSSHDLLDIGSIALGWLDKQLPFGVAIR